jgi:hypothetical protein
MLVENTEIGFDLGVRGARLGGSPRRAGPTRVG